MYYDETPKYIKNLKSDLTLALKKNMELRLKLEQMEEDNEKGAQAKILEIGEQFSQKIKECDKTT
jgi:hypothetical protein